MSARDKKIRSSATSTARMKRIEISTITLKFEIGAKIAQKIKLCKFFVVKMNKKRVFAQNHPPTPPSFKQRGGIRRRENKGRIKRDIGSK